MIATSAGAPTLSVPRSSKDGNTRAALTVAAERHAEHDELRHDVREVDDARGLRHHVPIRGDGIGPKALLRCALHGGPVEMIERPVAEIENDAASARGCHVREQSALFVEDAVRRRRVHMGDDVAALEQREDGAHRRIRLADVDHHWEIEGGGRLFDNLFSTMRPAPAPAAERSTRCTTSTHMANTGRANVPLDFLDSIHPGDAYYPVSGLGESGGLLSSQT